MVRFSAADCQRQWGKVQDTALVQPVTISSNGRDRLVMMSVEEFTRLKRRDRLVLAAADFTEDDVAAIRAARAPEEAQASDEKLPR
jgi:PHD/YefM family antitoxin component YafN of YafNO toxin-antitoxin module